MSASAQVRARAARVVAAVAVHGRSLDAALAEELAGSPQERGLLRSLSYESLRWHVRLEALLGRLLSRPGQKLAPEIRSLAIVGLCQLLHSDIPAHAAVDETVNAARLLGHPRAAGMINALLRRAQREREPLITQSDRDLAARTAHPRWLAERLRADWGNEAEALLHANNQRPPFWLRVNQRRAPNYRERLEALGFTAARSSYVDTAVRLHEPMDVHELPGFAAGEVSVQDAAAQLAAPLLAARAGDRVLDACAAPGGKTCHILELAPDVEELVALDAAPERLRRVEENLQRLGLHATLHAADATEPTAWFRGRLFDRILVDAPCSGTGVIRRHPDIKLLRREADIPTLAGRQTQLLKTLWPLLAPGGRLVYASCSVLRAETTAVAERFVAEHAEARDVTAEAVRTASGAGATLLRTGELGLRIAVGTDDMDGFYYACFQKNKGS